MKRHHHELAPSALRYNVPDESWIAVIRSGMVDPDQRFFVAEQHGKVIAFMRLRIDDRFFGRACEMDTVSVAPDFRNQKIGRTLMDEAERFAREEGAIAMRVNVLSVNESGRRFYEDLGYEVVAHRYAKDLD
ncbi:MAG TPA: GNAT family N-acetyltransferase [Actinomycetota bacterium]|nr:GNAT family N-acetyltransferase [Actinomycetota bacterium]